MVQLCRHTASEATLALQGLCDILYIRHQIWNVASVRIWDFTAQMVLVVLRICAPQREHWLKVSEKNIYAMHFSVSSYQYSFEFFSTKNISQFNIHLLSRRFIGLPTHWIDSYKRSRTSL